MLHEVGKTLNEEDLPHVFVEGNVHTKNKAIETFKSGSKGVRIIMLSLWVHRQKFLQKSKFISKVETSSESSASGINLTEASHIVLLDPVAGTREEGEIYF